MLDFFCEGLNPNLQTGVKPNSIVEKKALTNNCNFELSREVIQTYSVFLTGMGNITREKKKYLNKTWIGFYLFIKTNRLISL